MKTVVFLGAGASKAFGYPLTTEILPRMLKRLEDSELFVGTNSDEENDADRDWFGERLFNFLPGLKDSWKRHCTDCCADHAFGATITDVLTLVDRSIGHSESRAKMVPEDLNRFRQLLDRGIYETLVRSTEKFQGVPKKSLDEFTRLLRGLDRGYSLVTTNYDVLVDHRLFQVLSKRGSQESPKIASQVDFGFTWRKVFEGDLVPRPIKPAFSLLKLHGSINCLRCSLCGQIYLNTSGPIGPNAFKRELGEGNTCHCNNWSRLRLHLVTPSLVRNIQDAHLLGIWQAALEQLRQADRWIIIGYSFPSEDVAIRSLFLRAWDGRNAKPQIDVVQLGTAALGVYRTFFPENALTYHDCGLDEFVARELQ